MRDNTAIVLRPAEISDAQDIWRVTHAEGKAWTIDRIAENIGSLYVLTYGKRIIGVLCGTFTPGKEDVSWVSVNPRYPETALKTAMIQGLRGAYSVRQHVPQ